MHTGNEIKKGIKTTGEQMRNGKEIREIRKS
jgi:hypothetical protein